MKRTALLIDGGYLRKHAEKAARVAGASYNADLVEQFSKNCIREDEELFRVFYYDAPPLITGKRSKKSQPISGKLRQIGRPRDFLLSEIAQKNIFAVRRGNLNFRGWQLRSMERDWLTSINKLTDKHFEARFEQKGVDMRIGLDIATICAGNIIDRIVLVSADTDMIPAMKHARRAGVQVVSVKLKLADDEPHGLHPKLIEHSDFVRETEFPPKS